MWVRSQDRLRLQYVNRFEIEHFENKEIATITGHGWFLGEYSTEEKALLVLDMIEKVAMYPGNTLFQMPADDEVVTVKKRVDYAEFRMLEEEKKTETNFEHYFEYLSKLNMSDFALIDGRVTQCLGTSCSKCDFNGDCIERKFKWLKQPYKKADIQIESV